MNAFKSFGWRASPKPDNNNSGGGGGGGHSSNSSNNNNNGNGNDNNGSSSGGDTGGSGAGGAGDGVAWSGWLYKAGTKRKVWRHKFFKVITRGKGAFEHYGDTKSDKERGVMLFRDTQGVAWLEDARRHHQQQEEHNMHGANPPAPPQQPGRRKKRHSSPKSRDSNGQDDDIDLKFLMLTNETTWLMRCENYAQKSELQMMFATMVPTLVAVERQNFRRVEKQAITRRKVGCI